MAPSSLEVRQQGDVLVGMLQEAKILDELAIQELGQALQELGQQAAIDRKLLLDFSQVQFMSSLMIGQIMRLQKLCRQTQVALKLSGISAAIMEVFKITGLTKVLEIYPNQARALDAFGASAEE